jgi:hypothetical protein
VFNWVAAAAAAADNGDGGLRFPLSLKSEVAGGSRGIGAGIKMGGAGCDGTESGKR